LDGERVHAAAANVVGEPDLVRDERFGDVDVLELVGDDHGGEFSGRLGLGLPTEADGRRGAQERLQARRLRAVDRLLRRRRSQHRHHVDFHVLLGDQQVQLADGRRGHAEAEDVQPGLRLELADEVQLQHAPPLALGHEQIPPVDDTQQQGRLVVRFREGGLGDGDLAQPDGHLDPPVGEDVHGQIQADLREFLPDRARELGLADQVRRGDLDDAGRGALGRQPETLKLLVGQEDALRLAFEDALELLVGDVDLVRRLGRVRILGRERAAQQAAQYQGQSDDSV